MSKKQSDKIIRDKLKQYASTTPSHLWEGIDAILDADLKRAEGVINEQEADQVINKKLHQYASPTPAHLWEGIDVVLEEDDRKRRGMIWWWAGGAALLLLFSAALYFGMSQSNTNTESAPDEPIAVQKENTNSSSNAEPQKADFVPNNADLTTAEKTVVETTSTTKDAPAKKVQPSQKSVVAKSSIGQKNAQATISEVKASDIVEAPIANQPPVTIIEEERPEASENKALELTDFSENKNALAALQLATKNLLLDQEELDLDKFINKDPKCARFGKWLKLYFYVDAYVSPDIAFRTLSPKEVDFIEYSQTRDATESSDMSFSTGARFSVVSNYGWAARTGIVYSQINEKFDYQSENQVRTTITEEYGPGGEVIGYDTIVEYGARYKTTYNHYRMIDIPVIIGYEMNVKKLVFTLNSGVYLNILSRQKGEFLSPDNRLVSFSSEDANPYPAFKNRLNLSVYGSIGMLYNLNDHWQIMLEPHLRYYVDPLTKTDYMVEQSYFSTGLITGMRYKF